jgi:hypothetical protein
VDDLPVQRFIQIELSGVGPEPSSLLAFSVEPSRALRTPKRVARVHPPLAPPSKEGNFSRGYLLVGQHLFKPAPVTGWDSTDCWVTQNLLPWRDENSPPLKEGLGA